MTIGILFRDELKEYDFGEGHPFRGDRYINFPKFIENKLPENDNYSFIESKPASDEDLLLICEEDYIDFTRDYYRNAHQANVTHDLERMFYIYQSVDNRPRRGPGRIEEAARIIVGQAKTAVDLILDDKFKKVISIGGGMHHAKRRYGEGFCIYNDVAYVAEYLMKKHSFDRILILDTDAHAGNGTSDYFYSNSKVLFVDIHQDPHTLYPGTGFTHQIGEGNGVGYTVNIPMPLYARDDSYGLVFKDIIMPLTKEFKPQLIIRNGGSDPHFSDQLTNLGLTVDGFRMIGENVKNMANSVCDGKVIDLIASGYNKKILPYCWMALLSGLAEFNISIEEPETSFMRFNDDFSYEETQRIVQEIKNNLKDYWTCLN
jgi:acetoin utilization protein AcuC